MPNPLVKTRQAKSKTAAIESSFVTKHRWKTVRLVPWRGVCLSGQAQSRQISHEQHEARRIAHAEKMSNEEAKQNYSRRRHAGERPFAMIKGHFGARRFLTRGLAGVNDEWTCLCSAFNLHRLLRLIASNSDPPLRSDSAP